MKTLVALLCAGICSYATAQGGDVSARLAQLRLQAPEQIPFLEERHSAVLVEPALFKGYLRYDPQTRLMSKVVEAPQAMTMAVDEHNIYLERDGRSRTLALRSRPELGAFLAGFRGLLEGDSVQLERYFTLEYSEDGDSWTLRLQPRNRRLQRHLAELLIDGDAGMVSGIRTHMKNGDWQQLILMPDRAP